jgi:hypothetical protein
LEIYAKCLSKIESLALLFQLFFQSLSAINRAARYSAVDSFVGFLFERKSFYFYFLSSLTLVSRPGYSWSREISRSVILTFVWTVLVGRV